MNHVEIVLILNLVSIVQFILPSGLKGLPEQWKVLLKSSNISKDMAMKNKEALVDCFAYMEDHSKPAPLPKVEDFIQELDQGLS